MTSYFSKAWSRALALVLAPAMAVVALISVGSPAQAVTPNNSISHAFINLQDSPSATMESQYRTFLQSIQNAAGSPFRGSVFQLQNPSTAMIAVDVTSSAGNRVRLLLTPDNLYVRGFITQSGTIWQFLPGRIPYSLTDNLNTLFANHADLSLIGTGGVVDNAGSVNTLSFGSDYISMEAAAARGRSTMPISYNDLNGSVNQLATYAGGNSIATARSLMFMIQFVSEATRFNNVRGIMLTAMGTNEVQNGLPANDESLENDWGQLSQYAINVTNNSATAPQTIGAAGTLSNFGQAAAFLSTILGAGGPSQVAGGQSHDEL